MSNTWRWEMPDLERELRELFKKAGYIDKVQVQGDRVTFELVFQGHKKAQVQSSNMGIPKGIHISILNRECQGFQGKVCRFYVTKIPNDGDDRVLLAIWRDPTASKEIKSGEFSYTLDDIQPFVDAIADDKCIWSAFG